MGIEQTLTIETSSGETDEPRMITIEEFIAKHKARIGYEWTESNPHMADQNWKANHYKVKLACNGRIMALFYSMGLGIQREPTTADVLDCLASDASMIESSRNFEDWCGDLGYDTDSRKAEKTYRTCVRQQHALKRVLGHDAYQELLYSTERL